MSIQSHPTRRAVCVVASVLLTTASPAGAKDLADVIPDLFGSEGIILAEPSHFAHFSTASLEQLQSISDGIASAASQTTVGSSTASFTFDVQQAVFVRSTESLGPTFAERAETLGKGKLNFAFTYTRLDYKRYQGDGLDDLSFFLPHTDIDNPGIDNPFETDGINVNLDVDVSQNQFLFYGKYGITDRWEAGFILPVIESEIRASALATIQRDPTNLVQSNFIHNFCVNGVNQRTLTNQAGTPLAVFPGPCAPNATQSTLNRNQTVERDSESDTGFGDLLVRTKYNFMQDSTTWPDMSVLGGVRFDTGDEENFRGAGNTGFQGLFIASKEFGIFVPHLNWGVELTTDGGETNVWRLVAGSEVQLTQYATVSLDVLGYNSFNGEGINDHIWDFGIGAKVNPWSTLTFLGSILLPLNPDDGLRTNVTWTLGAEYTF